MAISVRIVDADYYLSTPHPHFDPVYSIFNNSTISQIPVIRIYGPSISGQKTCLHIHGVLPYFYVPTGTSQFSDDGSVGDFAASCERALQTLFNRRNQTNQPCYIHNVTVVAGIPFYGYYQHEQEFLKIYMYNPAHVTKLGELLVNSVVMGRVFQPHESHVPFIMQFFQDYSLYGMNMIDCSRVEYRIGSDDKVETGDESFILSSFLDSSSTSKVDNLQRIVRQSNCEIECDTVAGCITNKVGKESLANPGLKAIWEDEKLRQKDILDGSLSAVDIDNPVSPVRPLFVPNGREFDHLENITTAVKDVEPAVWESPAPMKTPKPVRIDGELSASTPFLPQSNIGVANNTPIRVSNSNSPDVAFGSLRVPGTQQEPGTQEVPGTCLSLLDALMGHSQGSISANSFLEESLTAGDAESRTEFVSDQQKDDAEESRVMSQVFNYTETLNLSSWEDCDILQLDGNVGDGARRSKRLVEKSIVPEQHAPIPKRYKGASKLTISIQRINEIIPVNYTNVSEISLGIDQSNPYNSSSTVPKNRELTNLTGSEDDREVSSRSEITKNHTAENKEESIETLPSPPVEIVSSGDVSDPTRVVSWLMESEDSFPAASTSDIPLFDDVVFQPGQSTTNTSRIGARNVLPKDTNGDLLRVQQNYHETNTQDSDSSIEELQAKMNVDDFLGNFDILSSSKNCGRKESSSVSLFSSPVDDSNVYTPVMIPPTKSYIMKNLSKAKLKECLNPFPGFGEELNISKLPNFNSSFQSLSRSDSKPKFDYNAIFSGRQVFTPARKPPIICMLENKLVETSNYQTPIISSEIGVEPRTLSNEDDNSPENFDLLNESNPVLLHGHSVGSLRRRFSKQWKAGECDLSIVDCVTPSVPHSLKSGSSQGIESRKLHELQNLTVMSVEVHVTTRQSFLPDPQFDPISAIFYSVYDDGISISSEHLSGVILKNLTGNKDPMRKGAVRRIGYKLFLTELEILDEFKNLVIKWDPDILVGFDVQSSSWGYLLNRSRILGKDLASEISRVPGSPASSKFDVDQDEFGFATMSHLHIAGRVTLNLWRAFKQETTLTSFTFESMCYHILHRRVPRFTAKQLTSWFNPYISTNCASLYKVIDHYFYRVKTNITMMNKLELITRTSELARLFGMLFYEVLTRGSQFRVESMLLRSTKAGNFIAPSPNIQQRAHMKAPEHTQLVLEPESAFYSDPVIVVDFQSLYPSIMIAYNYCYSTCLGRVENLKQFEQFALGALAYSMPHANLKSLLERNLVHVSPNGVAFVTQKVRKGIISNMVDQILDTRIMVKRFMKEYKNQPGLYKMLDARQLGLKLVANVTYGYTAASYSGRMPCVEVADSIVRKGREILETAINIVNNHPKWNARVVYGDTDSMFILLKNTSKDTAFRIGKEIADHITSINPKPVKLKFEKVYFPCVLITKKRYVGYSYETPDQKEPVFDAKGIETVRRDNCPIVGKMMEKSLRLLFESKNIATVKSYVQTQFYKVCRDQIPMQDFIFAKEYRGMDSYKPGACVAALQIAKKLISQDPMSEPRQGDRVPYCIVFGQPGLPLYELVRRPEELVRNPQLRINSVYYITKQILPAINRVFMLLNVDVFTWFNEMPRMNLLTSGELGQQTKSTTSIASYFTSGECLLCRKPAVTSLCEDCTADTQVSGLILSANISHTETRLRDLNRVCASCTGHMRYHQNCISIDCPVFHKLYKTKLQLQLRNEMCSVLKHL